MRTTEEKYKYLLSNMKLSSVDYCENDALISMDRLYFQFSTLPEDIDTCVEAAMDAEEQF